MTGLNLRKAEDLREATGLRNLALEMNRISNDLRLLSSGPKTGLGEISLPPVATGSSIMPGKVNPSMLEMMNMVCYQVMGCDLTISGAVQAGQLELNVMMPVVSFNLNFMIQIMGNALRQVKRKCIDGIQADVDNCKMYAEKSIGLAVALSPHIGYDRAAKVVKEALDKEKTLVEVVLKKGWLDKKEVKEILDPEKMNEPRIPGLMKNSKTN